MNSNNEPAYTSTSGSREKILAALKKNQPVASALPQIINYPQPYTDLVQKFTDVLTAIGGEVIKVNDTGEVLSFLKTSFTHVKRMVSTCADLSEIAEINIQISDPHNLADVDLFVTTSQLGVAENGAVWVKDDELLSRALPFIAQQMAIVIKAENIVATMHDAYDIIASTDYGFATFIAGPSKTADIAQSLVLGAHGPKTMTVFILQ